MNHDKKMKALEDRREWRKLSLARLELIRHGDLTRMFGLMAQTFAERRRESELDVLRCERFHPDNLEMIQHHQEQADDYGRRLEIASGVIKMLVAFEGEEALRALLVDWCENLPLWRETKR